MFRYVGLMWDSSDPNSTLSARGYAAQLNRRAIPWDVVLESPGLFALMQGERRSDVIASPDGSGCVIGHLFSKAEHDLGKPITSSAAEQRIAAAIHDGGETLVQDCWGAYVALLLDATTRKHYVVRDCSGRVPCYYLRGNGVTIVFSNYEDIAHFPGIALSINWQYVAAFLANDEIHIHETGIKEVSEILAGEQLTISKTIISHAQLWDPRTICRSALVENWQDAAYRLKSTTNQCLGAWASAHGNILLSLSGGLDSAIVLGEVSRSARRPNITCLNRYTEKYGEDERPFARMAAVQANVPLIEMPWQADDVLIDDRILQVPRIASPSLAIFEILDLKERNAIAQEHRARSMWTGRGGDQLFFQNSTPLIAADYVHHHGVASGLLRVIGDTARFCRASYWSTLRTALPLGLSRKPWRPFADVVPPPAFVCKAALPKEIDTYQQHSWGVDADDLAKGKRYQIHSLALALNRDRPFDSLEYASEHPALLSQPIIELCLQIPTYILTQGGRHRALARTAFSSTVPAEILSRESKGSTMSTTVEQLRQSMPYIQELLLEGALVKERVIDGKELEPHVLSDVPIRAEQLFPLMSCVAAEAWVQSWRSNESRAAA